MSTVYVIEPDAAIREGLVDLLQSLQWSVQAYSSPTRFLVTQYEQQNAVLVLDFDAENFGGLDFLRQLREHKVSLPIVLLSSCADNHFKAQALNAGAVDVIEKPLINEVLVARIRQCLPVRNS